VELVWRKWLINLLEEHIIVTFNQMIAVTISMFNIYYYDTLELFRALLTSRLTISST